jgi:hypothetical protein
MRHRIVACVGALVAAGMWVPVPVAAQAQSGAAAKAAAAPKPWTQPRTPDGQPDIQGIWNNGTYTPLERPAKFAGREFFTEQEALEFFEDQANADFDGRRDQVVHYDFTTFGLDKWQNGVRPNLRTSLIVDPPDGRIPPLTPEAQKRKSARPAMRATGVHSRSLTERCIKGYWGLPMLTGAATGADAEHQIVQTPGYVVIVAQSNNDVRIIPLDGRPHLSPGTTSWFGDARGRWEGDTLVVETTNFNDRTQYQGSTKALRLVERFTRLDENTLQYRFTLEDPATWTRPWTGEVPWAKVEGPVYEFACHESNYGLVNILEGAKKGAVSSGAEER